MGKISAEKIKFSLDILQVAKDEGFDPQKNGKGYKLLCPFHDDNNPSLSIDDKKQLFHCFGCGKSGDVIKFIEYLHNYSFKQAVEYLVKKYPNLNSYTHYNSFSKSMMKNNNTNNYTISNENLNNLVEKYHQSLLNKKQAVEYLAGRGITNPEIIKKFKIGYVNGYVTFPFFTQRAQAFEGTAEGSDENNNVGEIYSRAITDNTKLKHKYLPGPHKGILNLDELKNSEEIYLCECVIDAISLLCMGIKNVTCSFGKGNMTDELKQTLANYCKKVLITYDNDQGNDESAVKTAEILVKLGLNCERVILPPSIKDTNDFLTSALKEGKEISEIKYLFQKLQRIPYATPKKPESPVFKKSSSQPELVEDRHNIMLFVMNERIYKVKGLKRTAQMDLHILLSVEYRKRRMIGKVDLLSDRSRERYAGIAKDRLGVSEFEIDAELEELMIFLEDFQEKEYIKNIEQSKEDFLPQPYQITDERIQRAVQNLKDKDYLSETLLEDLDYIKVVGEEDNKILYTLALLSSMEDEPLHILIIARSGIGKSYIQKMILQLHPEDGWIRLSSATKQVLYYLPKDAFKSKCVSIDETSGIPEEAFYTFRTFMSEGRLELLVTEKDVNGVNQARRRIVDGPISLLLSTTNPDSIDYESKNRMVIVFGDESPKQTKRIIDARFFMGNTEEGQKRKSEIPHILQKHKDMMYVLRDTKDVIFIYESKELEERAKLSDRYSQSRRNSNIFAVIIRCVARTRIYRKDIEVKDGRRICKITLDDVELGEKLMRKILINKMADVKGSLFEFYNKLCEYADSKRDGIPRNEYEFMGRGIRIFMKLSKAECNKNLRELVQLEYLVQVRAKNGTDTVYRIRDNENDFKRLNDID